MKTLRPPDKYSASIVLDRAITRLRMGTTLLPGGAGKYVLGLDPACPRCLEPLTAPHVPYYQALSDQLQAALHSHGPVYNLSNVLDPREQQGARYYLPLPTTFFFYYSI
ncbi:hypothetical protein DPMN_090431 [Dreissena polymorpha]|uniref:Uncharacterized protein n=1 Tax=Dreissena polymorpha TaxID=45954 RepID=A0A9D4QZ03_DREPO|nr:hypothetical protein DPMN_090431 [Dreissena polymorpha]